MLQLYSSCYQDFVSKIEHKKYFNLDNERFSNLFIKGIVKCEINETMRIYWNQILLRINFASVKSIMRNQKWFERVIWGIENSNILVFSASLRGFFEVVTDSYFSLSYPATYIARNFHNIKNAITGNLINKYFTAKKLEEELIHFEFASKYDESGFRYNKPLSEKQYMENFPTYAEENIMQLYSELCEVTHPASRSIILFTTCSEANSSYKYTTTCNDVDHLEINRLLVQFAKELDILLKISISAPFISLKVLNQFESEQIRSAYIDECMFNIIISNEGWENILLMIKQSETIS